MSIRRIAWVHAALVITGLIVWGLAAGRLGALSFLTGALTATLSFWLLYRFVSAMGGNRPGVITFVLIAMRLVLAGLVLYVILTTYEVHRMAAATGILAPVAAITLVTLYDLIYARSS